MSQTMAGRRVLVVGASSGIGRAAAAQLAREGASVVAAARRADRLEELKQELAAEGLTIETRQADAGEREQMEALAAGAGAVDTMVFAAGINTPDRAMARLTPEIWDKLIRVNLNGAYYITNALLPGMRERRDGSFIYISSISAYGSGDVSGAAYQASKRGLLGLALATRLEEKDNGIRTCVISPGLVDTEILSYRPVKTPDEIVAKALQAEDVAEAVVFVAKLPKRAAVPEMIVMPSGL